jgi:dienelactone hydrolase
MRKRRVPYLLALALATLATAPSTASACSKASWTGGETELCRGTFVYRDYVYDDYGASRPVGPQKAWPALSAQVGDDRYPSELENSADLLGVELRIRRGRLWVRFPLSAYYRGDETIAALAIDHTPDRGGGQWPELKVASDGWDDVHLFKRGDPKRNEIRGSIPLPPGKQWRVQAAAAQPDGTVMNVAFRGTDESGAWWEEKQAAALARGDISQFGATVKASDLIKKRTRPAPLKPGFFERVYRSDFTIGPQNEGYSYDGVPGRAPEAPAFGQEYNFLGRHQPYGIYVPKGRAPHGIQLVMHGFSAAHASLVNADGMQQNVGDARNRIVLVPLGRGQAGFYSDYSERDVLDVLDDVERTYPVDRDRVFAGGYSMGGYGTLRLGALYPDRFAGYINWVGFTGDDANGSPSPVHYTGGAIGNAIDFVGNFRHVPGANMYATGDELVHAWTAEELNRRLAAAGVPYAYYFHPAAEHLTFAGLDDWRKESDYTKDLVRVKRPARVTYRTQRVLWNEALGLRHDRAYWVSRIEPAGEGYADVDLTTHGCGGAAVDTAHRQLSGSDPVPWTGEETFVTGGRPFERAPRLTGELRGVRSLTVDSRQTCLRGRSVQLDVKTDGPVTLRLSDGRTFSLKP